MVCTQTYVASRDKLGKVKSESVTLSIQDVPREIGRLLNDMSKWRVTLLWVQHNQTYKTTPCSILLVAYSECNTWRGFYVADKLVMGKEISYWFAKIILGDVQL